MFVTNDTSLNGFSFTYPPANAKLTNLTFNMEGRLSESITQLTCQLFLQSNSVTAAPQFTSNDFAAGKWTLPVADLAPGPYTALAMAHDNKGRTRLVRENFNLLKKLVVGIQPPKAGGVSASLSGKYLEVGKSYTISATPGRGQIFAFWAEPGGQQLERENHVCHVKQYAVDRELYQQPVTGAGRHLHRAVYRPIRSDPQPTPGLSP